MEFVANLAGYIVPFVIVLTIIVFVHELGHYWVARRCGVRVEVFSIGFGPELFGWNDRHGTRWKISAIPLGGFVKFFGDADASSGAEGAAVAAMSEDERKVSFHHKHVAARSAIVVAGPVANFIFAILIYTALFSLVGQPFSPAVVGNVVPNSAAAEAGLKPGDRILAADGSRIDRFEDLRVYVALRAETPIDLTVRRDGQDMHITVTPRRVDVADGAGGTQRVGQIGIGIPAAEMEFVRYDPATAAVHAVRETWQVVSNTFTYLGRIIHGRESGDQLSGPLGIAKMSGDMAKSGWLSVVVLMATLSIAIGLINLFPVPMLDGGHLLFYGVEAVRGRPLGERAQEYGFRIGFGLVLSLFLFATWNDLNRLSVFSFLAGLFS